MDPAAKIHAGFEPVMPSYAAYLKPPEVSALVEFIKSLKDAPGRSPVEHGLFPPSAAATQPPAGNIGLPAGQLRAVPGEPWHDSEPGLPAPGRELQPLPRASRQTLEHSLLDGGTP
jgi:hypothetical protein